LTFWFFCFVNTPIFIAHPFEKVYLQKIASLKHDAILFYPFLNTGNHSLLVDALTGKTQLMYFSSFAQTGNGSLFCWTSFAHLGNGCFFHGKALPVWALLDFCNF
jgi:hypothetical protein